MGKVYSQAVLIPRWHNLFQNISMGHVLVGNRLATLLPITNSGGPGRFILFPAAGWPPNSESPLPLGKTLAAGPFTIFPTSFKLERGATVQLHVSFEPPTDGSFQDEVVVVCDNCNVQ